jgi:predicted transcriptional regulator
MARRHKYDIIADILTISIGGTKKTRLVYQTNLNFTILKKYLKTLISGGLIEETNGYFTTTWKGIEYIEKFSDLKRMFIAELEDAESLEKNTEAQYPTK